MRLTLTSWTSVSDSIQNLHSFPTRRSPDLTVTNLAVTGATDTSVTLTFTQVDDGSGKPAMYDVRSAGDTIDLQRPSSVGRRPFVATLQRTAINTILSCTFLGLWRATGSPFQ